VRGLIIHLNAKLFSRVTALPLGLRWSKEDKTKAITTKNNFFSLEEKLSEHRNGVRWESLPYPWGEVAYHILK